jgi:predicted nucleic acid-binding protein
MPFVVDASATLAWCFQDEATDWSRALLQRVLEGESPRIGLPKLPTGFSSLLEENG